MGHLDTLYLPEIFVFYQKEKWLINCLKFAPNAPEQNPVEYIAILFYLWQKSYYFLGNKQETTGNR